MREISTGEALDHRVPGGERKQNPKKAEDAFEFPNWFEDGLRVIREECGVELLDSRGGRPYTGPRRYQTRPGPSLGLNSRTIL